MTKNRLEAFSDGVIAIIITVMVLELKVPHGFTFNSLRETWPELGSYSISFIMLGIYWNNHHHLFQAVKHISGNVMWANLHLLFWLSLLPFGTEWMRDAAFAGPPVAFMGIILVMSAVAFSAITTALVKVNGKSSEFAKALGSDFKGKCSIAFYVSGIAIYAWAPYVSCALYVLVAVIWFIPDRRFANVQEAEAAVH
jgi:uncharacterized membrane protein